jgi:hypothetical protein
MGRAAKADRVEGIEPTPLGFRLPMAVHTWYGLNGKVRAAGPGTCDIAVEGKALPHPSLVNLYLRRGLSSQDRVHLGVWHEAGHLQTLPLAFLYALALTASILLRRQKMLPRFLLALLSSMMLWELNSEAYTVARVGKTAYREAYSGVRPLRAICLAMFWVGGGLLALLAPFASASAPAKRYERRR